MKCGVCGHANIAGVVFCSACGKPITPGRHLVEMHAEQVTLRETRRRLRESLLSFAAIGAVFLVCAIAFRSVVTRETLPRFPEIPVARVFPDLPVQDGELLPHPWLALPETGGGKPE